MKRCLHCNTPFSSLENICFSCGLISSTNIKGFAAYAPDQAHEGEGFKSSFFATLAELEDKHFWFRARNRLIVWALKNYFPNFQSFLEIGCGTGFVLSGIAKAYPHAALQGSELFINGLTFAANRLPKANFMQMDARNIPFFKEFDAVGAFDVLEHIEQDEQVLTQIHQALKPQGIVIITVPQHQWLWSPVDELACHVRRYSAEELHSKLRKARFKILHSTSFVSTLLPLMLLSRLIQKLSKTECKPETELRIPASLNYIFEKMLNMEIRLIKHGINLPFGGSRMIIGKKVDD